MPGVLAGGVARGDEGDPAAAASVYSTPVVGGPLVPGQVQDAVGTERVQYSGDEARGVAIPVRSELL
jgi:hypothetical protein